MKRRKGKGKKMSKGRSNLVKYGQNSSKFENFET
jgi:hypothetical protein